MNVIIIYYGGHITLLYTLHNNQIMYQGVIKTTPMLF